MSDDKGRKIVGQHIRNPVVRTMVSFEAQKPRHDAMLAEMYHVACLGLQELREKKQTGAMLSSTELRAYREFCDTILKAMRVEIDLNKAYNPKDLADKDLIEVLVDAGMDEAQAKKLLEG